MDECGQQAWYKYKNFIKRVGIILCLFFLSNRTLIAQDKKYIYTTPALPDTASILKTIAHAIKLKYRDIDSSVSLLKTTLKQSQDIHFEYGISKTLIALGYTYNVLGESRQGLAYLSSAVPHCYKCAFDKTLLPMLYLYEVSCYTNMRDYQKASACFYLAMQEISQNNLEDSLKVNLDFSLGLFSGSLNQYDKALGYFHECEKIAEKKGDTIAQVISIINQGGIYKAKGELPAAQQYMSQAETLSQKYGYTSIQQGALSYLGDIYSEENKPKQAIEYYKKAVSLINNKNPGRHHRPLITYYLLATAYYRINDFANAKKILYPLTKKAQAVTVDNTPAADLNMLGNMLMLLGDINVKERRYKEATKWLQSYISYRDKISNKQNTETTNKLELKYRISEKDKQIAQKQLLLSEQKIELKNKDIWIGGVSACVVLLSTLAFSLYRYSKHKQKIQAEKIYNLEQEKEIGQLKAILEGEERERTRLARELHDGIGGMLVLAKLNLGSIKEEYPETAHIAKLDDVMELLNDTAAEIRQTAHNLMPDVLIKNSLQEALLLYCSNINTGNQLDIDLQFHGEIDQIDKSVELILYRITQELIQNIVKHAHATQAIIQIIQDKGRLNLIVEDDGAGFDVNSNNNSFGLQNLQFRVQALQGYISITSAEGKGTSIYIEFDLQKLKQHNRYEYKGIDNG